MRTDERRLETAKCHAALRPPQASGLGDGHFRLLLTNAGPADLAVQLEAADREHGLDITFEPPLLVVPAGQERSVPLRVHPRAPLPGEDPRCYPFTVTARPTEFPHQAVEVHGEWKQLAPSFELEVRPAYACGVREGSFTVSAANRSLEGLTLELAAVDAAGRCTFAFQPDEIIVPAGESAPAQLRVRAREPLPGGEPRVHAFTVTVRPREAPQVVRRAAGVWEQSLPALALELRPLQPHGHAEGVYHLEVRNADDVELTVGLEAADAEGACFFNLVPPLVVVPAGQVRPVQVRVQPRSALRAAEARPRPFAVTARPAEAPGWTRQVEGTWVQLPAPLPAARTWGPLALFVLGWALAWAGGVGGLIEGSRALSAWHGFLTRRGCDPAAVHWITNELLYGLLQAAVVGLAGGLAAALALAWAESSLRRRHALVIWAGWCLSTLVGGAALAALQSVWGAGSAALPTAALGAATGLAGGAITGVVLRRAVRRARPWVVALGWAITGGVGAGLAISLQADLDRLLWPVLAGLPGTRTAVLAVELALVGAVFGLGGGVTALSEIAYARRIAR